MPMILINAANQYAEKLAKLVSAEPTTGVRRGIFDNIDKSKLKNQPVLNVFDEKNENLRRIFPDACESHYQVFQKLLTRLVDMVPAMSRFVGDKDNLISDRMLAASAIFYLITPFDIIPDDEGLAGAIDDALVTFRLAQNMFEPSDEIEALLEETRELVREVENGLPEWVTSAISRAVKSAVYQQQTFENSQKKGGI